MTASGGLAPLVAAGCFLVAGLGYARGWRTGFRTALAGVAVLSGGLAARGLLAGYWPLTGAYDFALALGLSTAVVGLLATSYPKDSAQGVVKRYVVSVCLLLAGAVLVYARLGFPVQTRAAQPPPPALRSLWLPLHAGSAALSYGAFALAGAVALVLLLGGAAEGPEEGHAWLEDLLVCAVAGGYPLLTGSILLGMIWAQGAWGRYWSWDLKEVWALASWLIYTLFYHVRQRPRWQGRPLYGVALAGFVAVLWTLLGVGWLARMVEPENLHLF